MSKQTFYTLLYSPEAKQRLHKCATDESWEVIRKVARGHESV